MEQNESSGPVIKEVAATGRRKTSVARVRLLPGTGAWKINKVGLGDYFKREALLIFIQQPLRLVNSEGKYDIIATVRGGGISGQAGALRHAIARALVAADPSTREVLRGSGCLTRDPRMKERKKAGQPGARKRFQFSKR
jgi:small subunit ribosomal protein S9